MDAQILDPNRFAAIVYEDGAKVDGLMTRFARELVAAGVDARGIVQLPPDADDCGPGALMKLQDVATGEVIPLCQDLGPGAGSCCLDSSALARAAQRLRIAASEPSDIPRGTVSPAAKARCSSFGTGGSGTGGWIIRP